MSRLLIRCNSHRARHKAFRAITPRIGFWSLRRNTSKGVYEVSNPEYEHVKDIKGITRFKDGDDLMRCWT